MNLCKLTCSFHSGLGVLGSPDPPLWPLCFQPYPCSLCTPGNPKWAISSTAETQDLPSYLESGHPSSVVLSSPSHFLLYQTCLPSRSWTHSATSIKVFPTAVPTAWNSPPTHTPSHNSASPSPLAHMSPARTPQKHPLWTDPAQRISLLQVLPLSPVLFFFLVLVCVLFHSLPEEKESPESEHLPFIHC